MHEIFKIRSHFRSKLIEMASEIFFGHILFLPFQKVTQNSILFV